MYNYRPNYSLRSQTYGCIHCGRKFDSLQLCTNHEAVCSKNPKKNMTQMRTGTVKADHSLKPGA